jgi:hypothetical protein
MQTNISAAAIDQTTPGAGTNTFTYSIEPKLITLETMQENHKIIMVYSSTESKHFNKCFSSAYKLAYITKNFAGILYTSVIKIKYHMLSQQIT